MSARIFIIEDEPIMAECLARAARRVVNLTHQTSSSTTEENPPEPAVSPSEILTFSNAISAMAALGDGLPDLILLDILLDGPDGFTFLNELISYPDTAQIPVIIVSSLDLSAQNLSSYGVVATLHKDTMTPASIAASIQRALAFFKNSETSENPQNRPELQNRTGLQTTPLVSGAPAHA